MRAKDYLEQYEIVRDRAELYRCQLLKAEEERDSISSSQEPGHGGGTSNRTERTALRVISAREAYDHAVAEMETLQEDIEKMLLCMPEPYLARLLYDRYVRLRQWRDIANDIGYSEEYSRGALHWRALMELEKILPRA